MRSIAPALLLALFVTACGGATPTPAPAAKPADRPADKPADKPVEVGPDFASWDVPGKAKAWQGSWVVKENGTMQAWTVTGEKVEVWDGKEDRSYNLKVAAPCRAYFEKGGLEYPREFAVTDGKLRFRAGGAGFRRGAEAVFCDPSGDIYTLDAAGACALWKSGMGGKYTREAGECGFKKDAKGAEVFWHKGSNEGEFVVEGDALLSDTSVDTQPAADHAAAKAARDAVK